MKKKILDNFKKFEPDIRQNYDKLIIKGFTYSIESNKFRTIDKINRLSKKKISQQIFDDIVYPDLHKDEEPTMLQDLNPNITSNEITDQCLSVNMDEIMKEIESNNKEQQEINDKSSNIQQPRLSFDDLSDDETMTSDNQEIVTKPPTKKNQKNITPSSDLPDEMNILFQFQLKALNELRKQAEEITDEITRMIQSNQPGSSIDQLRKERRNMWEKIEDLEKGIQAANSVYASTKSSKLLKKSNSNIKNSINEEESDNKAENTSYFDKLKNYFTSSDNEQDKNDDLGDDSDYSLTDMNPSQKEDIVFDENTSEYFDIYPEEKDQINPAIFNEISKINHEVFHHSKFRGCQAAAIESALNKNDVFLLMPTGGGKSLVYQIAGYVDQKLTIIISPLISLIKDQVNSLKKLNLSAYAMIGETSKSDFKDIVEKIKKNEILFLYITPEKLLSSTKILDFFYNIHQKGMIARFVIDEAHCVSQWGHDFRPAYTGLDILKNRFENLPILVMTATATSAVKKDIINILKIHNCQIFQMSFNRPNLIYEVLDKGDTYQSFRTILTFIHEHNFEDKCGIIFCMTVTDTEAICSFLNNQGLRARYYHAQMEDKSERHKVQKLWMKGEINIIVATLAFGMGIDKPDVRFVIHHTMPKSIESYYQESGRAGRDGIRSYCVLLFNYSDRQKVERLVRSEYNINESDNSKDSSLIPKRKNNNRLSIELQLLDSMTNYCLDKSTCRRVMLLNYFSENFNPDDCNPKCDNCIRRENGNIYIIKVDLSKNAEDLADIINEITLKRIDQPPYPTARYVISIYTGVDSNRSRFSDDSKLKQFGLGAGMSHKDYLLQQVFPILIEKKIIKARIKLVKHGTVQYFATGPNYEEFKQNGFPKIEVEDEVESRFEGMTKEDSELYPILLEKRRLLAEDRNINPNSIFSTKILRSMTKERPRVLDDLIKIHGMTNKKAKDYGKYFLEAISRFEFEIGKKKNSKENDEVCDINLSDLSSASNSNSNDDNSDDDNKDDDEIFGVGFDFDDDDDKDSCSDVEEIKNPDEKQFLPQKTISNSSPPTTQTPITTTTTSRKTVNNNYYQQNDRGSNYSKDSYQTQHYQKIESGYHRQYPQIHENHSVGSDFRIQRKYDTQNEQHNNQYKPPFRQQHQNTENFTQNSKNSKNEKTSGFISRLKSSLS